MFEAARGRSFSQAAFLFLAGRARPATRLGRALGPPSFSACGIPSIAAAFSGERRGAFAARGANSKPTLPSAPRTRNAENGLPFREMNRCKRSVLPVASSFCICSGSMGAYLRPEIELGAELRGEAHHRGKRLAGPAAEAREGSHRPLDDQRLDLLGGELAAGDHFPDRKVAFLALELAVVFLHLAAALRARGVQCTKCRVGDLAPFDARHHLAGKIDDVIHELAAREIPVLHLLQLEFPVSGELRRRQLVDAEVAQRKKERRRLRRRLKLAGGFVWVARTSTSRV